MSEIFYLRNVEVDGHAGLDVRLNGGAITHVGVDLPGRGQEIDGKGGALIPGLADHHVHLLSLAAKDASVDLAAVRDYVGFEARLLDAARRKPAGGWIRAIGYHELMAGDLDRRDLDRLTPYHPLRLQHQTGALWILNSLAISRLGTDPFPACVERDAEGRATGRIWRGDVWLRSRLDSEHPPLRPVGRRFAEWGITHLTDASVTTDREAANILANAHRQGDLPQKLTLMSGLWLCKPDDEAYQVGAVKVLLDECNLPELGDFISRIAQARDWGRRVAVHCVTATELALTLAAFEACGALPNDRIEHGGVIPISAIAEIRSLGLTVVTQPVFINDRGDRYLAAVKENEQEDLYRCGSLLAAGVPTAASSDAPYGDANPWSGTIAAVERRTSCGRALGLEEKVTPAAALSLYLGDPESPGGVPRRVAVGASADLCLLDKPISQALANLSADGVAATFICGTPVYIRG